MNAFTFDDGKTMGVNNQMIDLSSIPIKLDPNAVQNQDVRIISKEALEVKRHLLFGSAPRFGKLIIGIEWIKFLVDHSLVPISKTRP